MRKTNTHLGCGCGWCVYQKKNNTFEKIFQISDTHQPHPPQVNTCDACYNTSIVLYRVTRYHIHTFILRRSQAGEGSLLARSKITKNLDGEEASASRGGRRPEGTRLIEGGVLRHGRMCTNVCSSTSVSISIVTLVKRPLKQQPCLDHLWQRLVET